MNQLNKKQKIILSIIATILIIVIGYYVYGREENIIETEENKLEIEETKENKEDKFSDERILIHVSGAVEKEGIVELKADSRISEAIEKAGGIKQEADLSEINLAFKLEDGMKIYIPTKQEKEKQEKEEPKQDNTNKYITSNSGAMKEEKQETKDGNIQRVNLNTATQTQLETLPGIGPSTALKILNYRKEKGKFKSIEEIKEVSGIGDAKFDKIKEHITV